MTKRKFHRYVVRVEILSEDELNLSAMGLSGISYAITEGDCSGDYEIAEHQKVDGATMAKLLIAQGSDPGFFQLTENGNDEEGEK